MLCISIPIVLTSYGQKFQKHNSFVIDGKIDHFGNGYLVGSIVNGEGGTITLDTLVIINDVFKHECNITDEQVVDYVAVNGKFSRYKKVIKDGNSVQVDFADKKLKSVEVVAYPGAKIKITGFSSVYLNAYPLGDLLNEQLAALNRKRYPLLDKLGDLDYSDRKNIRAVLQKEEMLVDSITSAEDEFIRNNPSSIVSSYLVQERFPKLNKKNSLQADSLLTLLRPRRSDIYYKNMLLIQRNRSKENSLSAGEVFPYFQTRFVYNDSAFNLNQARGKYTLIDFWGSWCIPCVREMPKLEAFYERYKDRLVIIGIANDTYQNWKAFLDKNAYRWIQVIDQEPIKLSDKLNIEAYPTKYLLDPGGKIIMIIKESDEQVWSKIESLMNTH